MSRNRCNARLAAGVEECVVEGEWPAQQGIGAVGRPQHDELPRSNSAGQLRRQQSHEIGVAGQPAIGDDRCAPPSPELQYKKALFYRLLSRFTG